jgi:membrane protein required for colicin V production
MLVYDIIMLVVLVAATLWGVYKGLAWQIASMASIFCSYLVAMQFRGALAGMIKAEPPWNYALAMLILYLGTSLVVWVAFRLVRETIDKVKLQEFDKHVGGVLGFAKGAALCVVITLFAVTLLGDAERQQIVHSYSGYYIAVLLDKSHAVLPQEVYDKVHPLLHSLDQSLPAGYEHFHGQPQQPNNPWQPQPQPQPPNNGSWRFSNVNEQPPDEGIFNFR